MHIQEAYTMNSIAEIFDNSKQLLDGITTHYFYQNIFYEIRLNVLSGLLQMKKGFIYFTKSTFQTRLS